MLSLQPTGKLLAVRNINKKFFAKRVAAMSCLYNQREDHISRYSKILSYFAHSMVWLLVRFFFLFFEKEFYFAKKVNTAKRHC